MMRLTMFAAALALLFTQEPHVTNGRLTAQTGAGSLDATFHRLVSGQTEAGWIGYSVPTVAGNNRSNCCNDGQTWISDGIVITNGRVATCGLEPGDRNVRTSNGQAMPNQGPVRLEGPDAMLVLFRVENHEVQKIRIYSPDCELDAGGTSIQWLDGVAGPESVKLLSTFIATTEVKSDRLTDAAIAAIALHRDEAADAELERLAGRDHPEFVRKKVTFWLGNERGHRGFEAVRTMAHDDPSEDVRKSAMFALSQSKDDQAVPELIRFAREDASPKVRGEAIFWLAQRAGQKVAAEITAAIENDPDTDVKKRAVFALSQLPKDEGVPLLIKVARTNTNPAVRKQAIFWLGQSKDPRATEFFAEVLK